MKKPSKSFEIVLSAIACAVAAVSLTVGCYVNVLYAAGILLAVFAIMVPLSKDFIWGAALAFLGAALLAFMFCAFSIFKLVPFILFFGLHPIVNHIQLKYVKKKWIHAPVLLAKAVWFILSMWLSFHLLTEIFALNETTWYDWVIQYFHYVLWLGGAAIFVAYDILMFLC
ncbi:MAG: hypothetical protein K2L02_00300, partial [Clostridia bacterium]|nr:hypothetical protein [Clostridia bacterium]